jgi:hypothetical protein
VSLHKSGQYLECKEAFYLIVSGTLAPEQRQQPTDAPATMPCAPVGLEAEVDVITQGGSAGPGDVIGPMLHMRQGCAGAVAVEPSFLVMFSHSDLRRIVRAVALLACPRIEALILADGSRDRVGCSGSVRGSIAVVVAQALGQTQHQFVGYVFCQAALTQQPTWVSDRLASKAHWLPVKAGDVIVGAGDLCPFLGFVQSGSCVYLGQASEAVMVWRRQVGI